MSNYVSSFVNGAAVDAELTKVANSNLSADHKITRSATLVVAASDSSANGKAQADYVCDGTADNVKIQAALDALPATGGKIQLLDGTFKLASTLSRAINSITIEGCGYSTFVYNNNETKLIDLGTTSNWTISNIYLDYGGISLQSAIAWRINNIWIKNQYGSIRTYIDSWAESHLGAASDGNLVSEISKHPLIEVFSDFESDTWETLGTGSQTFDTDVKYCGTRSLKCVTAVGSSQQVTSVPGTPIPDFTNCAFSVMVYTPDYTAIDSIELDVKTVNRTWLYTGYYDAGQIQRVNDKWFKLVFPYLSNLNVNDPDYTTPQLIRFRIKPRSGVSATVYLDDFRYFKRVLTPRGAVTFTFDDGLPSVATRVKPIMDKYNYAGVASFIIGRITSSDIERANALQNDGWDIVNHSYDHDGAQLSVEPKWQYILAQKWLRDNGFVNGARFALLAGGTHSTEIENTIEKYITFSRSSFSGSNCLPGIGNLLNAITIKASLTVDGVKAHIDNAIARGTWVNFMFHDIVTSGAVDADLNYLVADFEEIVDYCNSSGIEVLNYSQVVDRIRSTSQHLTLSGTGTITNDTTSVNIRHGFHKAPTSIQITPTSSLGSAASLWVSSKDTGTGNLFTVSVDDNPGVDVTFEWVAVL
ncbi:MAG: polysaccharide deacetylase family protein [Proteiniphilum sp.]|nr:polysaccharide deacetylase family protein [Proteiniphilum sp.]